MKKQSVENYVIDLAAASFPERRIAITRATDLVMDLDADSMMMVSLIFSISEKFGISTDRLGDILLNCRTVGDLIAATERLQRECV
jgi:acyl carrier protein